MFIRSRSSSLWRWWTLMTTFGLALSLLTAVPTAKAQEGMSTSDAECLALNLSTVTDEVDESAQILSARVEGGGDVPRHCDITGRIGGRITFALAVPIEGWDGRYVQVGGGGFCGTVPTATGGDKYVRFGSAVSSNDSGHVGSPFNADFAYDDPQAEIDWAYLASHLDAQVSKAILARLFGQRPVYSYFQGCSTGGRQGLMAAQRYPDDFDGITAGAPANRQNYLAVLSQGYREVVNHREDGSLILRAEDADVVSAAVLEQCDLLDGVADQVVHDPRACDFDTDVLLDTLTEEQVDVVRRWYDDPRNSAGESMYPGGIPLGSEAGWTLTNIVGDAPAWSFGGQFAEQVLRYLAFPDDPGPTYDLREFDFDTDPPLLDEQARLVNADDPDMSAFRDAGGRMLLWHGSADPLITPLATIEYYEEGLVAMGPLEEVQDWYRLFMLPGVYHCSGGPGADGVDLYAAIIDWVEADQAPDVLVAEGDGFTRPLYPYPTLAVYSGEGDETSFESWVPVEGPRGRLGEVGAVVERIAGPDRIQTAAELSRRAFTRSDAVVIATAGDFPDALSAAVLAAEVGAPVLLNAPDRLADEVAAEVDRLGATTAYLLGGEAALSAQVGSDLEDAGVTVRRLSGATRIETAVAVADEVAALGGPVEQAVVALGSRPDGDAFPDALAAGNVAARGRAPILLAEPGQLPGASLQALVRLLPQGAEVVLAGGAAAVSEEVASQVREAGLTPVRVGGEDRYGTAVALAERAVGDADVSTVVLASGRTFPDALAAAATADRLDGVLLLVDPLDLDASRETAAFLADRAGAIRRVLVAGGAAAVSDAVVDQVRGVLAAE